MKHVLLCVQVLRVPPSVSGVLPKRCPVGGCSGLVVGVKRYGRSANKSLLDLIQLKHLQHSRWVQGLWLMA